MEMKLTWEDAQTFLSVSEFKSFSAAAKDLDVGQPTVSRRIQNLERLLSMQLFVRGKQGAMPTEAALKLLPAAEQMARWAVEFDRLAMGVNKDPGGLVRIAAPPGIAVEQLAPFARRLKDLEPNIRLEVLAGVDHIDLARGHADLAIRTQAPNEPELIALDKKVSKPAVYAAPSYVKNLTQPCQLQDLDWITWAKPYQHVTPRPMLEKLIPDFEPSFASDDYLVQKAAANEGLGALIMGTPTGNLVKIDVGVEFPESEFYIVCAKSMQQIPRIISVVRHLKESLGA